MKAGRHSGVLKCAFRRYLLVSGLLLAAALSVPAQTVQQTPGAIARLGVPAGFQYQYDPTTDAVVLLEPERRQLLVFAAGPGDTADAVMSLLAELGGQTYARDIRPVSIAGTTGSEVRIDAGSGAKDRILALAFEGMLLGFWGKTVGDPSDLDGPITAVIRSLSLAAAIHPQIVVGMYQTRSTASTDWRGDGLFSQEYVTLAADGTAQRSSHIGGQVGDVGVGSAGRTTGARWEVRGNRLLLYSDGSFFNYTVQAFRNGLELYDQDGRQYLWVRQ